MADQARVFRVRHFKYRAVEVALVYQSAGLIVVTAGRVELLLQRFEIAGAKLLIHVRVPQLVELQVVIVLESLSGQCKQAEILKLLPRQSLLLSLELLRLFHLLVLVLDFGVDRNVLDALILPLALVDQVVDEVVNFYN